DLAVVPIDRESVLAVPVTRRPDLRVWLDSGFKENPMKKLIACALLLFVAIGIVFHRSPAQTIYIPHPVFCPTLSNAPCSQLPSYIGPDPRLGGSNDY